MNRAVDSNSGGRTRDRKGFTIARTIAQHLLGAASRINCVSGPPSFDPVGVCCIDRRLSDLYKNSGGTVQVGVGPTDGCDANRTGSGTWYVIIQNTWGCSGYMWNYLVYESGTQSYMRLVGSTAP